MEQKQTAGKPPAKTESPVIIESSKLFGEGCRVQIQHENRIYQLTITRQNKLILTR